MVFGKIDEERLSLNDDTLYSGGSRDRIDPDAFADAIDDDRRVRQSIGVNLVAAIILLAQMVFRVQNRNLWQAFCSLAKRVTFVNIVYVLNSHKFSTRS